MSSTASTSSISSFYTENGVTRLNGSELMSGLDTQKLIDAMTAKTQSKIDKQNSLEQVATWRREMYREVESLMQKLSDDYFSFASDTNILSSTFFSSLDLVSSSSAVSATGTASNAGNVVVNSVSQTAKAAVYTTQDISGVTTIQSGALRSEWAQSAVGGKSLVVGYGGKQYTLTVDSSVTLDSGADADANANLTKITDNLNKQIASSDELKGHVEFSAENGQVTLKSTDGTTDVSVTAYKADGDDTSGETFLSALGLSGKTAAASITGDTVTTDADSPLFNQTVSSASYLKLKVDGTDYTVYLGTDEDGNPLDLSNVSSTDEVANAVAQQLQSQIAGNSDLKDKVSVTSSGGKITITGGDVSGGSENLLQGLGLQADGGTVDKAALTKSYLGDTLAGSTVSFTLDGVTKAVSFSESEKDDYDEAGKISGYLQKKLNTAFGSEKVTVAEESGRLTFSVTDSTSVLKIASASASGVLGEDGALRLRYGAVNRLDTTMTLDEYANSVSTELSATETDADGKPLYELNVNGKAFTFSGDNEIGTVLSTISNDSDAGVNIQYSQTSNRFRILADDTGAQGRISVQDVGSGNLASVLHLEADENAVTIKTGEITNLSSESDSTYSLSVGGGQEAKSLSVGDEQEVKFTIAGGTYDSINSLKDAAQTAIDTTGLNGKIQVGVSTDGKHLIFGSTDGSSFSLAKDSESAGDILGLGDADEMAAAGYAAGQDLKMNVVLGGGETQDITRSTNSFDLDGLHLTVTGTTEEGAEPIKFSSSGNVDDLVDKISAFVDEYNKLIDKANQYTSEMPYGLDAENGTNTKYGPLTDAQKEDMTDDEIEKWNEKAKQGLLQNDGTLNSILSDLREAVLEPVQSAGLSLSAIGISTTSDVLSGGKLAVDKTALESALQSDPDRVAELFTNTDGVSGRIKQVIEKNIGAFGNSGALIEVAGKDNMTGADNSLLSRQISDYESNVKKLQTQLQTEKSHWLAKFTTMETKLSALTSQYDYLSSVLSGSGS